MTTLILALLVGCGTESPAPEPAPADAPEKEAPAPDKAEAPKHAALFGTLPDVMAEDPSEVTDAKVALGRTLYYDPRLSKNHDISCNSCHMLDKYGVDNEPTSPGHKGVRGARNSPTTYNAAAHLAQFWDGRAEDVEAQALGPVLNPVEMAMPDEEHVLTVLKSVPGYTPMFKEAFGDEDITYARMGEAIGAFERKLVTRGKWDAYLEGDAGALTDAEKAGLDLFVSTGCTTCHLGPAVGGTMYQKMGLVNAYETEDVGRAEVTDNDAEKYFFKVPSLRNIAKTGPYLHDGSVESLDEVVKLMAHHQLGKELTDEEVASIVTFLEALTGEIPKDYVAKPELPESGPDTPKPDPA